MRDTVLLKPQGVAERLAAAKRPPRTTREPSRVCRKCSSRLTADLAENAVLGEAAAGAEGLGPENRRRWWRPGPGWTLALTVQVVPGVWVAATRLGRVVAGIRFEELTKVTVRAVRLLEIQTNPELPRGWARTYWRSRCALCRGTCRA